MDAPRPRAVKALDAIDPARQARETRLGWRMAGVAMQTASEVAAGAALGWVVDHFADTRPWGLLIGGCLGIVVALTTLIRTAWRMNSEMDRAEVAAREKGSGVHGAGDKSAPLTRTTRKETP